MHCNNGLNNKLVESLVENKVAQETGDLKYLQDSMYKFVKTLKEIILGEYSPEFFNKYVDEALKLHGSNLDEFLKIPKMGLELRQALNSIDEAIDSSNQEFKDNLVLLLDKFQTTLDNMEYQARDPYDTAVELGFTGTKQEWLKHLEGDSAYEIAVKNGYTGTEEDWLEHLEGDSAYKIAVDNGFVGSKQEWLTSLKPTEGTLQALTKFMNNNAETMVTVPELGNIPSLQGHIKQMFEIGGLPAKPFATKALMAESALVNGDYAMVTDETANNGLYVKTAGAWVKSDYDPLGQAKQYADSNPLFKPQQLPVSGADANALMNGIFLIWRKSVADRMLNLPPVTADLKLGTIYSYNTEGVAYQLYVNYNTLEKWERTGNGGTIGSSFAWRDWKAVANKEDLEALIDKKPTTNLFINPSLTSEETNQYQAVRLIEGGQPVLSLNANGLVYYDQDVNGTVLAEGNTVTLSADVFCDVTGLNGCDISIQALNAALKVIDTSSVINATVASAYQNRSTSLVLPANTAKVRIRLIRRGSATIAKFKNILLSSDSLGAKLYNPFLKKRLVYVSKSGIDSNDGSKALPYLTIQKAVNALNNTGGIVTILDSEIYREAVLCSNPHEITIMCARNQRAKIFGSDRLVITKTAGFNKVYQASLAAKPAGMGSPRGLPMIAEWGTPYSEILPEHRHDLHRGKSHRLPYTPMYEASSKAELDTPNGNGKWFWESGVIYLSATDGSDATLKQYEARARRCIYFGGNKLNLYRIDCYFSNNEGFWLEGITVHREDCGAYGNFSNGFSDNSHSTMSIRDQSIGNGNDGFNGTVTNYTSADELTSIHANYIDPYSALNGDDDISYHIRGTCNIDGGLLEFSRKAGVVHVTGGGGTCKGTIARGQTNGFYVATVAPDSRMGSAMTCIGTIAEDNEFSYRTGDDSFMNCIDTIAHNPSGIGYLGNGTNGIKARNAKYNGDTQKAKSGLVNVISDSDLI